MIQIFFIFLLNKIITSTIEPTPGIHNSHNKTSGTTSYNQKFKNEEYQVFYDNNGFSAIDIEFTDTRSEIDTLNRNCDDTSLTTNLISFRRIKNEDQTNPTCSDVLKIFGCRFIVCCSILLALFAYASYYFFGKNHRAWGFFVAISFLLFVIIFCAIVNGFEKLKINKI